MLKRNLLAAHYSFDVDEIQPFVSGVYCGARHQPHFGFRYRIGRCQRIDEDVDAVIAGEGCQAQI